jgi:hypothetical protein
MKKIIMMMLAVVLVLANMPITFAAEPEANFEVADVTGGVSITGYTGSATEVEIPATINSKPVVMIGEIAFKSENLTSVTIPASVTEIGQRAFQLNKLTSVEIPAGVTKIGDSAFSNNALTAVEIPAGVTRIGFNTFSANKLTSIEIPNGVTVIGTDAFESNLLTSVELPDTLTSVGYNAFKSNRLRSVTIPDNVTYIGEKAFLNNPLELITFKGSPEIGNEAFSASYTGLVGWYTDSNLSEDKKIVWNGITVPTGKVLYGKRTPNPPTGISAVAGDSQATISFTAPTHEDHNKATSFTVSVFKDNVEQIGLKTTGTGSPITVTNLTNYTDYTFKVIASNRTGASTASAASSPVTPRLYDVVEDANGVTITNYLGTETVIVIPATLDNKTITAIGEGALANHNLKSVTIPSSVTTIADEAFYDNRLEHVIFEGSPTIGISAFDTTKFPEFVGWYTNETLVAAWDGTSVPTGGALYAMRKPNPPSNVNTEVRDREIKVAFTGPTHTGGNAVTGYTVKVLVDGTENSNLVTAGPASPITVTGLTHDTEYTFKVIATNKAGNSVESSASEAVKAVVIFDTIDNIDGTVTITKYNGTDTVVEIPSTIDGKKVTVIGESAFYNKQLTAVTIPGSVTLIEDHAFSHNNLTNVTIPDAVTTIGESAFSNNKLTSVTIPGSVVTVGINAFTDNLLEQITFGGTPNLGTSAFLAGSSYMEFQEWYTDPEFKSESVWDGTLVPDGKVLYGKRTPNPPNEVSAVAGLSEATVSFTGPTHIGGNVVTGYSVKVYVDGIEQINLQATGITSPITVTGLTNGTAYTFKVVATNPAGDSVDSEATITPVIPRPLYDITDHGNDTVTITGYNGSETDIVIPNQIDGKSVIGIGDTALQNKSLTSVTIPDSVTSIGSYAFQGNSLTIVTIPANVITIGSYAFQDNFLTSVTIPASVTSISSYAFADNQLELITFEGTLTTIGSFAFDTTNFPEFVEWYTDESLETVWVGPSLPVGGKLYGARTPNPPKGVSVIAGDGQATVTFTGPTHEDHNRVESYKVKVYDANGTEIPELNKTGTASPITVTGLDNNTAYTFRVIATNGSGDSGQSHTSESVTPVKPIINASGSNGGSLNPAINPNDAVVNGPNKTITPTDNKVVTHAKVTTSFEKDKAGAETTIVKLDKVELNDLLAGNKETKAIVMHVNTNNGNAKAVLQVRDVENTAANNKDNVFIIKANGAEYSIPATLVNSPDVAMELGISKEAAQDAEVEVTIVERPASVVQVGNSKLAANVIEFTLHVRSGDKRIELNYFGNSYINRAIDLNESIIPAEAVGVVIHADGSIAPVPTQFIMVDGKQAAVLKRNSNSLYTVVSNKTNFTDITTHWAQNDILLLGHKLIINGYEDGSFKPNGSITRGEFVTIIARSLGFSPTDTGINPFMDVNDRDWYAGALKAISTYKLVNGFSDGTFRANEQITRQDATVILSSIITFLELNQTTEKTAKTFKDVDEIFVYARDAVETVSKLKIINGYSDNSFKPTSPITRGEAVSMITKLLEGASFISQ